MCLAIYKPVEMIIPKQHLKNAYDSNNDGCGLCWAVDGEIHVKRGMMTFDDFYAIYEANQKHAMLIHFRKSTHGKKDENNCHPFLFNDNKLALVHNGVIPIKCSEEGFSDTWHFVNKVLDPLIKNCNVPIENESLSWFIRSAIGSDKILVMNTKGQVVMFNADKGNWEETEGLEGKKGKVWYSNYSYKSFKTSNTTGYCNTNRRVSQDDENNWRGYNHHCQNSNNTSSSLEIADDTNRGPGKMTEYGWFDSEIEEEIEGVKKKQGMAREDAILHVFNNA